MRPTALRRLPAAFLFLLGQLRQARPTLTGDGVGNQECWGNGYTYESCCTGPDPEASPCWNGFYTFGRCCHAPVRALSPLSVKATEALRSAHARWQGQKLREEAQSVQDIDRGIEALLHERLQPLARELPGRAVLCVGARLGGEVRAFTRRGALAVGIDFNPGPHNLYVLPGVAEHLQFADGTFDFVYSNVVDHISDVRGFASEAHRVLRNGGQLWLDAQLMEPHDYEVRDLRTELPLLEQNFSRWFEQVERRRFERDVPGLWYTMREERYVFRRRPFPAETLGLETASPSS